MGTLFQDARYGLRMLGKDPAFTAVAALTLALGIGANTALFSVIDAVLLRPLPYREANRLVSIGSQWVGYEHSSVSIPEYLDYREQNQVFQDLAAYHGTSVNVTIGKGEPERILGADVTASLFPVLRAETVLGRTFLPDENQPGRASVVLLSYGLWQRRFGGDPNIVGKTLQIHTQGYSVAGVMAPGFSFPESGTQIWSPLVIDPENLPYRGAHNRLVIARLKPGVSLAQAQAEMDIIASRLAKDYSVNYPAGSGWGISLRRLRDHLVGDVRPALLVLMAAVGFVLLIVCANLAHLLLARANMREKELAIRRALGAGRSRLIRQLLVESILLAVVGGSAGLLIAWWGVDALTALTPGNIPRLNEVSINSHTLGFSLVLSLFTGLLFGLAPALQGSTFELNESLKEGGRSTASGARHRMRNLLAVSEVALALVLLVGAGLMIRSFLKLVKVDPGFNPDRVLTTRVSLTPGKYSEAYQLTEFYQRVCERLEAQPEVVSAGAVTLLPLSGSSSDWTFGIEGYTPAAPGLDPDEQGRVVSPGYFRTLGIPLLRGRLFENSDTADGPQVVIVSRSLAQKYWGDEDALGKRIKLWSLQAPGPLRTVVGIVDDVRHFGLATDERPILYYPQSQFPHRSMTVIARTATDPVPLDLIRRQVLALDREQPVYDVRTKDQYISASVAQPRFNLLLLSLFAALALILACVGIYGVMAHSVSRRTHEIGIRMALGAQSADILRLVVGQGMRLTLLGVGIGLVGALALTRLMASLLFGISSTDPTTFVGISLLLVLVALLASYIPARRATRVDPMVALRYE